MLASSAKVIARIARSYAFNSLLQVLTRMPLLVVSALGDTAHRPYVKLSLFTDLTSRYAPLFDLLKKGDAELYVRVFVRRVYNMRGEVIKEYAKVDLLPIRIEVMLVGYNVYVDFTEYHKRDGIPLGYYVELLLVNFRAKYNDGREEETPIFPNEYRYEFSLEVPQEIRSVVEREVESLRRLGRDIETVGMLYEVNLGAIAEELIKGLKSLYTHNLTEAITSFRKVIEWLRDYVKNNVIPAMGEHRQKFLYEFLSKAYQLISNFGLHAGTNVSMSDVEFSRDIAFAVCRYIATYLKR